MVWLSVEQSEKRRILALFVTWKGRPGTRKRVERRNYIRDEIQFERKAHNHLGTEGVTGTVLNICLCALLINLVCCVGSGYGRGHGRRKRGQREATEGEEAKT